MKKQWFVFLTMFALFVLTSCISLNDAYTIDFHDGESVISSYTININRSIKENEINEVERKIKPFDGYFYKWSYSKDELQEVNFYDIKDNTKVYLYWLKEEFKVSFTDTIMFDCSVETVEKITYQSDVEIKVVPLFDTSKYYFEVLKDDEKLECVGDNKYIVSKISKDVLISFLVKEKITLVQSENEYVYDGIKKDVEYKLYNSNAELLENKDIKVTYKLNNEQTSGLLNVGSYQITYEYTGKKYYFESLTKEVKIIKQTPKITSLPTPYVGFEGCSLSTVALTDGTSSVLGIFKWCDDTQMLSVGTKEYKLEFIPSDTHNYECVKLVVMVTTLTKDEALDAVKTEKEYVLEYLEQTILNEMTTLPKLITAGQIKGTIISWASESTVLSFDDEGCPNIIKDGKTHQLTIVATITLGDAIEYVTYEFTLIN